MSSLNINHLVSAFQKSYTTIKVVFNNGADFNIENDFLPDRNDKRYTYKCLNSFHPKVGDIFIVHTLDAELKCVTVTEVHLSPQIDFDSDINYKWVVDKVDSSMYDGVMESEKELKDKIVILELESKKQQYINTMKEANPQLVEEIQKLIE